MAPTDRFRRFLSFHPASVPIRLLHKTEFPQRRRTCCRPGPYRLLRVEGALRRPWPCVLPPDRRLSHLPARALLPGPLARRELDRQHDQARDAEPEGVGSIAAHRPGGNLRDSVWRDALDRYICGNLDRGQCSLAAAGGRDAPVGFATSPEARRQAPAPGEGAKWRGEV